MSILNKIIRFSIKNVSGVSYYRNFSFQINQNIAKSIPPILAHVDNNWIYQRNERIESPFNQKHHIELPKNIIFPLIINDPIEPHKIIDELPKNENKQIEAARLIVIRRQKMKNHKLKKLRKRLKFERAKQRQKRELRKEKEFQAVLIQQCKEAEAFSAEEYVEDRIKRYQAALAYIPKDNTLITNR